MIGLDDENVTGPEDQATSGRMQNQPKARSRLPHLYSSCLDAPTICGCLVWCHHRVSRCLTNQAPGRSSRKLQEDLEARQPQQHFHVSGIPVKLLTSGLQIFCRRESQSQKGSDMRGDKMTIGYETLNNIDLDRCN